MRRHDFVDPPDNAVASSCAICGRPRESEIHSPYEMALPETLEELRVDLFLIRRDYEPGSRQWFALTIAHGTLAPNRPDDE